MRPRTKGVAFQSAANRDEQDATLDSSGQNQPCVLKRVCFVMPQEIFQEVRRLAKNNGWSMSDVIRIILNFGIAIIQAETSGAALVIQKEDQQDKPVSLRALLSKEIIPL